MERNFFLRRGFSVRGSYSLSAILSITAGIVFMLGVINITRYVHAVNAVEQAARSTARCLTPTDPECFTFMTDGIFDKNSGDESTGTYSTITKEHWVLSIPLKQQPARKISPILNDKQLVYAYVDITAEKEIKTLLANYNADLFVPDNNGNGIVKNANISAADWKERLNTNGSIQPADFLVSNNAHIQSSHIAIPNLSREIRNVTVERDAADNPILAYKLLQEENKNNIAYAAFRVFLTSAQLPPDLNTSTFNVETFDANGAPYQTSYLKLTFITTRWFVTGRGTYDQGRDDPFALGVRRADRTIGVFGVTAVPRGGSFRISSDLMRDNSGVIAEMLYQIEDYNSDTNYIEDTYSTKVFVLPDNTPDCAGSGFSSCKFPEEYSYKDCTETDSPRETVAVCDTVEIPNVASKYILNVNNYSKIKNSDHLTTTQCPTEPIDAGSFSKLLPADARICDFKIVPCDEITDAEIANDCPVCESKPLNLALTRSYESGNSLPVVGDFNLQMLLDLYSLSQEELNSLPYEIYLNRLERERVAVHRPDVTSEPQYFADSTDNDGIISESNFYRSAELAKQRGYTEIARTFHVQSQDCMDKVNCSQVSVTKNGPNVVVDVSYNLPLTFPFDTLVKDFVVVNTRKEEAMELFTGR